MTTPEAIREWTDSINIVRKNIRDKDNRIHVRVHAAEGAQLPSYATEHSGAMDVRSNVNAVIYPGDRLCIGTGLTFAIPEGYKIEVHSRSGLTLRNGIVVLNAVTVDTNGIIDADYRGEFHVILGNLSEDSFEIKKGDRIAQIEITKVEKIVWEPTLLEDLGDTKRGNGGFGHTGVE